MIHNLWTKLIGLFNITLLTSLNIAAEYQHSPTITTFSILPSPFLFCFFFSIYSILYLPNLLQRENVLNNLGVCETELHYKKKRYIFLSNPYELIRLSTQLSNTSVPLLTQFCQKRLLFFLIPILLRHRYVRSKW